MSQIMQLVCGLKDNNDKYAYQCLKEKIDEIIDKLLKHVEDEKPITARQCIKAMPLVAQYKPDLADDIIQALRNANTQMYKGSMQPLVYKDIAEALKLINNFYNKSERG